MMPVGALVLLGAIGVVVVGIAITLVWVASTRLRGRPLSRRTWQTLAVLAFAGGAVFVALEMANAGVW